MVLSTTWTNTNKNKKKEEKVVEIEFFTRIYNNRCHFCLNDNCTFVRISTDTSNPKCNLPVSNILLGLLLYRKEICENDYT